MTRDNCFFLTTGRHISYQYERKVPAQKWEISSPYGVAVDVSGNVYVADSGNHSIQKLDSTGTSLAVWGSQGSGPGQFYLHYGVAKSALYPQLCGLFLT